MQPIRPTPGGPHNPNGHTEETILAALRGSTGSRQWSFRYERLSFDNQLLGRLDNVLACTVEQNWLADIKRKANFNIRDTGVINFLRDRIKPWARLGIPPYGANDWVEWPQGVFLLSTPKRNADMTSFVQREVEGYDALQVFADDAVLDRYTVDQGENYIDAINALLGSIPKNVAPTGLTLSTASEWPPGTTKLAIINELLNEINYESLSFDEDGVAIVQPYVSPDVRSAEYRYLDDKDGLIIPDVDQELDLFSIPNSWVLVVSDPDRDEPLIASYTNNDPASPTSTVSRQRTIVDYREEQEAADQSTLDAKVRRLAFEASQIFEAIDFKTAFMPVHSGNDVYHIRYDSLAINAKYSEHNWKAELKAGAEMEHRARRVVSV